MEAHADAEQYPLIPQGESVAVIDLALLEGNIADWPQIRALLTAYISQHLQEGSDYYTLIMHEKVSKPLLSNAGSEKLLRLFTLQARFPKRRKPGRCSTGQQGSSAMSVPYVSSGA